MAKNNYYIPVNTRSGVVALNANKIDRVKELIPPPEELHLRITKQLVRLKKGLDYTPYTVTLESEDFNKILKEIKRKVPQSKLTDTINVVTDSNSIVSLLKIVKDDSK